VPDIQAAPSTVIFDSSSAATEGEVVDVFSLSSQQYRIAQVTGADFVKVDILPDGRHLKITYDKQLVQHPSKRTLAITVETGKTSIVLPLVIVIG
jgi:hypothetical protein